MGSECLFDSPAQHGKVRRLFEILPLSQYGSSQSQAEMPIQRAHTPPANDEDHLLGVPSIAAVTKLQSLPPRHQPCVPINLFCSVVLQALHLLLSAVVCQIVG